MIIPRDYFKEILSTQKHSFCLIPSTPRAKNTVNSVFIGFCNMCFLKLTKLELKYN